MSFMYFIYDKVKLVGIGDADEGICFWEAGKRIYIFFIVTDFRITLLKVENTVWVVSSLYKVHDRGLLLAWSSELLIFNQFLCAVCLGVGLS